MVLHGLYGIAGFFSGAEAVPKDCCFLLKACLLDIKNSVEKKRCLCMVFMNDIYALSKGKKKCSDKNF